MTTPTTSPNERRQALADAAAERIGELLEKALKTTDPLELIDIKAAIEKYDQSESLDLLLTLAELIQDAKHGDIKAAIGKKQKAEKTLTAAKTEYEQTLDSLKKKVSKAEAAYRSAAAEHAIASVNHHRFEALRTGDALPGYSDYTRPSLRAWAKRASIVK